MMRSAAAITSGGEPSTATPSPAHSIIEASLRPSPTATVVLRSISMRSQRKRSAEALSLSKLVNSKYSGTDVEVDGEKFVILRESDILGVLE